MYRERGGIHLTRSSNSLFPTRSNLSLERGEEERSRGASFPKFSTSFYLALERACAVRGKIATSHLIGVYVYIYICT